MLNIRFTDLPPNAELTLVDLNRHALSCDPESVPFVDKTVVKSAFITKFTEEMELDESATEEEVWTFFLENEEQMVVMTIIDGKIVPVV